MEERILPLIFQGRSKDQKEGQARQDCGDVARHSPTLAMEADGNNRDERH